MVRIRNIVLRLAIVYERLPRGQLCPRAGLDAETAWRNQTKRKTAAPPPSEGFE